MSIHKIIPAVLAAALFVAVPASAHVTVKPAEVGVASYQTFTVGVPNEEESNATVSVRLVMPEGLKYVQPSVKPGWTIETKKSGEGLEATVTEITWTGGQIPSGQRDDFQFAAQVPAQSTTLNWKAYQTYADGKTVSWDQAPTADEAEGTTPYSQTKVVDDIAAQSGMHDMAGGGTGDRTALILSLLALILGAVALGRTLRGPAAK